MIVYLKSNEIDRILWDSCIAASQTLKPYPYSWYLDIMAPGWEALIDDEYDSVFPVPARSRFGIKYIATPIFLQQLGAFSPDKSSEKSIDEFLDYMPEFYRLIDLCVGQSIYREGYAVTEKYNYELDLSRPYDALWNNFQNACKRNIEKSARRDIEFTDNITPDELVNLFMEVKEKVIKGIRHRDFKRLIKLMEFCLANNKGRITGVRDSGKKILFGQFLIETPGYINLFFGVNSQESRRRRINYFFINEIIKANASTDTILDFAGSSIPSIAAFIESFGSEKYPYYRIFRNILPWPVRLLK
jgi:hypothetical protein